MTLCGALGITALCGFLMLISHYYGFWAGYAEGMKDATKHENDAA